MVHTYFLLLHVGLVRNRPGIRIGFRLFGLCGGDCGFSSLTVGQVIGRQFAAFHQGLELFAADLFTFHQHGRNFVQLSHVLGQDAAGRLVRFIDDIADLVVDLGRDGFRVALALAEVAAQERLAGVTAVDNGAQTLREAITRDHRAGGLSGLL